jgi:hypothetical protein
VVIHITDSQPQFSKATFKLQGHMIIYQVAFLPSSIPTLEKIKRGDPTNSSQFTLTSDSISVWVGLLTFQKVFNLGNWSGIIGIPYPNSLLWKSDSMNVTPSSFGIAAGSPFVPLKLSS